MAALATFMALQSQGVTPKSAQRSFGHRSRQKSENGEKHMVENRVGSRDSESVEFVDQALFPSNPTSLPKRIARGIRECGEIADACVYLVDRLKHLIVRLVLAILAGIGGFSLVNSHSSPAHAPEHDKPRGQVETQSQEGGFGLRFI